MMTPLFLFVLFLSIHRSLQMDESKPKIIVFKGSVDPLENCVKLNLTNTTACAVQCAKNESCLLAVMKSKQCTHCRYGSITSLTREGTEEYYIALKFTHGFDTLIQDSSIAGYATSSLLSYYSPAPKEIEETCPFGKTYLKTCPDGWEMFKRGTIWYCLKVFTRVENMSNGEGWNMCIAEGGILSGLETMQEAKFVNESATKLMKASGSVGQVGWMVWLSGKRKESCRRPKDLKTEWDVPDQCKGVKGFTFDDHTLTRFDGNDWDQKEPNDKNSAQPCIAMMIAATSAKQKQHGKLDDLGCERTSGNTYNTRGVLCGRLAE